MSEKKKDTINLIMLCSALCMCIMCISIIVYASIVDPFVSNIKIKSDKDNSTEIILANSEPIYPIPEEIITPSSGSLIVEKKPKPKISRGRIIIIIDDVGYNTYQLEPFLKFPGPITFAVLPDLVKTDETAQMILASGKELILHQPMEAACSISVGTSAIFSRMKPEEIETIIEANIKKLPGLKGANYHMGSIVAKYPEIMRTVIKTFEKNHLYFVDSLTIIDSAVHTVSLQEGIMNWERDIFLDTIQSRDSFVKYITDGAREAEKKGHAILIGHVWSNELAQTLIELYPHLIEQGYTLETISQVMLEDSDENTGN